MNERRGLIDYRSIEPNTIRVFTGNAYITVGGALVMGRGAAKQVLDTYPGINIDLALQIGGQAGKTAAPYWLRKAPKHPIMVFQVKHHFKDQASLELILQSAYYLSLFARVMPHMEFQCNFPGIGNGGLDYDRVRGTLETVPMPSNLYYYR